MRFAIAPIATLAFAAASLHSAVAYSAAQPPVGRQAVQGPNPENLTQTYFIAAESDKLSNGVPDSLQLSFQIGSYFGPAFAPSEYYVVVSGTKAGVPFTKFLLDPNDTISVTDFSGNWGIGSYEGTAGWSSVNAMIHAPEQNVKGYINLAKSTGPPAWGCGPDTGTNMESLITPSSSAAEVKMFKGTSWAHFASGNAHVNFDVDGVELDFTGPFESETSYSPPYQEIYSRFIYVFTTIGPYDIAVWHVAPPGEPTKYATVGYLAENNHLIVNRCNTVNTNGIDSTTITTIGSFSVTGSSLEIAGSLTIDFTDKYGKHFVFAIDTLKATGASFPTGNTIIGQATATGGIAGGHQCNGSALVLYYSAPGVTLL